MNTADALFLLTIFLGFLTLAGYIARVWPATWPGGDYAEMDREERRRG